MEFTSKEAAVQHLSDILNTRVIIAADDKIKDKIVSFLIKNKNPNDDTVHKFAEELQMDVHKLESKIYELATNYAVLLNSGRAKENNLTKDKVDPKELQMGIEVEKEHTSDINLAEKVALDHLSEIPNYYTLLKAMEETVGIKE